MFTINITNGICNEMNCKCIVIVVFLILFLFLHLKKKRSNSIVTPPSWSFLRFN